MGYEVVDVSGWPVVSQEPGGAEPKDWLARPGDAGKCSREHLWLYKEVRRGTTSSYRRHDDIAERLASALAAAFELPAAEVELACRGGDSEGIISRNVAPECCAPRLTPSVFARRLARSDLTRRLGPRSACQGASRLV